MINGYDIPEAWTEPIIKTAVRQRTTEGTTYRRNSEGRNSPITVEESTCILITADHGAT